MSEQVMAIVVSYNPDLYELVNLLKALIPQVAHIIVVDNASLSDVVRHFSLWTLPKTEVIRLPDNFGIAFAQNTGIERAMKLGADFVLLADQDSRPTASMVYKLLNTLKFESAKKEGRPVAAVGPATFDRRTGQLGFFITEWFGIPCKWRPSMIAANLPSQVEVGFLIASGTLIPMEVIKQIGAMRSSYFIDHVDTEWCLRARLAGYRLLGVPTAQLEHRLGDTVRRIWFFGIRHVMGHSPLRDYYMFRNTLLMLNDAAMPLIWKIHFAWRLLQFSCYFLAFENNRRQRFNRIRLGLVHALLGLRGRLDENSNKCLPLPISNLEP